MHRRRLLIAALGGATAAALRAQDAGPRYKVSAGQLQAALAARFPMRLGIPGLAELALASPQLLLLPGRDRVGATLQAQASGSGLAPLPPGTADLLFALRLEASDWTVRAVQPELARLDWPGLDPASQREVALLVNQAAGQLGAELVLHRFSAQELALPAAMGFVPSSLRVEADGVAVAFALQPLRPPARAS